MLLMAAASLGLSPQQQGAGAQPPPEYVIGPQDSLIITVVGFPELSGKFGVNADGTFTFPLAGRVQAAGLTARAIERELAKRLIGFVKDPEVTVSLEQSGSRRYFIMGAVARPDRYILTGTGEIHLIEALARAGFVTPQAGEDVLIYHGAVGPNGAVPTATANGGRGAVARVSLADLENGKLTHVAIRDGDLIVVPRASAAFVFGFARTNGSFTITKETTVMELIALAGGVTERGALNRVYIVRQVNGAWEEIRPQLTDVVQPGDVVFIPEKRI